MCGHFRFLQTWSVWRTSLSLIAFPLNQNVGSSITTFVQSTSRGSLHSIFSFSQASASVAFKRVPFPSCRRVMAFAQKNFVSLVAFVHQVAVYRDVCTTIGGFRGGAEREMPFNSILILSSETLTLGLLFLNSLDPPLTTPRDSGSFLLSSFLFRFSIMLVGIFLHVSLLHFVRFLWCFCLLLPLQKKLLFCLKRQT